MSDQVLIALISIVPTTLGVFVLWLQGRKNHNLMNSRLSELLKTSNIASKAQGKEEGKREERKEVKERKNDKR